MPHPGAYRSDPAWDAFAAREPYFAVLTDPRYLRANFDAAAEEEFFRRGDDHVNALLQFIRTHAVPLFQPSTILEYGCGVGRLLIPFSRHAARVVGVDVSASMLATARRHLERAGVSNAELIDTVSLARDQRRFDMVNCYLVLQRMPRDAGLALLRDLASRVRDGGLLVAHFPFRTRTPTAVRWTRAVRSRVPGVNAALNLVRGKAASTPLINTTIYDLNEVFALLHEIGFDTPLARFVEHGDVDSVVVHAQREHRFEAPAETKAAPSGEPAPAETHPPGFIDVRTLIAEKPLEELNRTAEVYFSSLRDWKEHLAKPFSRIEDVPQLMIGFGVLLQGLSLVRGMTVLEFGAGTGWLSRALTQLGCRTILMDVSPTALQIARELFEKQPVFGSQPEPRFLVFDGRKIDLPDASVDRVVCFDAFHHAANPEEVLAEFKRVLRPGGIAGFAEPGPWHSTTPQSQFEMRTYGVLENDIDVHAIWRAAQRLGFADMRLAAFNVPPFHVSLAEYDDLLASGEAYARWARESRTFMTAVRTFFLRTGGTEELDSRRPEGLRAAIEAEMAGEAVAGTPIRIRATVRNAGHATWRPSEDPIGGVSLACHLYDGSGELLNFDYHWERLPRPLAPEEALSLEFSVPPLEPGRYVIEVDCVAEKVAWFGQLGSQVKRVEVSVGASGG